MENLTFSFGVTLLGMITVFLGLVILIAFITVLGKVTSRAEKKKTAPVAAPAATEKPAEPAPAEPVSQPQAEEGISPEVIAAITAAVAMVWQGETGFTVRHVKRIGNAPAWARAGREEQTYSRL